jgi:hypothetical protein
MIKQDITFENFDGETVTETHYFHLSKSELLDMASEGDGGLASRLVNLGTNPDGGAVVRTFKDVIRASYGQRVDGSGSQFFKRPDLTEAFLGSLAFDQLLTDLLTDVPAAISFINGLIPKDIAASPEVQKAMANANHLAATGEVPVRDNNELVRVHPSPRHKELYETSGLQEPYNERGGLLPWAHREPSDQETRDMTQPQLRDVFKRKSTGWKPPAQVPSIP